MLVPFPRSEPEVPVIPGLEVVKEGSPTTPGEMATFTVTVRNTGDVPLTQVSIDDDEDAVCGNSFAEPLPPGAERRYTCGAVVEDYSPPGTVTVTAVDPQHKPVRATYDTKGIVHRPQVETVAPRPGAQPDVLASAGVELEPLPLVGIGMVLVGALLVAINPCRSGGQDRRSEPAPAPAAPDPS
ncbi:DUF11 domain-containing protein [Allokutzneria sp. A3M-2-11 16]|uniref:DUF11 domain-containing protein n=1 Tax=Allokutzneria sp. A3M-2-11 16 TaxID=2962043 RepID=UPI0020B78116|nr:DUF11 domain-containing protein [Allokutzneria sp. A3M-2-11 16]MCP3799270.1 DUF11 domain-containing protein [Allokutzneria sp. A3M-2-11 16]